MAIAVLGAAVVWACTGSEKEIESGRQYMSTVYNDTTTETFGRTARTITGMLVEKTGGTVRFRIHTNEDQLVSKVDLTLHSASKRGQRPVTQIATMPNGTLPLMGNSVAFLEQLLRRARGGWRQREHPGDARGRESGARGGHDDSQRERLGDAPRARD